MSLDLDWSLLDAALADSLLTKLNRSLSSASRPDFLGPISLTSLDFGEDPPDVRLTQVGDVWRQFLDVKDAANHQGGTALRSAVPKGAVYEDVEGPDDVSDEEEFGRKVLMSGEGRPRRVGKQAHMPSQHLSRLAEQSLPFTGHGKLQTFRHYTPSDLQQINANGSMASFPASVPPWATGSTSVGSSGMTTPAWSAGLGNRGLVMPGNPNASGYFSPWHSNTTPPTPAHNGPSGRANWLSRSSSFARTRDGRSPTPNWGEGLAGDAAAATDSPPAPQASSVPSLQLQFSVVWSTNTFKLGINTSLLVNHPTPAFMELPLSVSVIGLGLQAGCVVAFEEGEGKGRKVHLSLVEDEEEQQGSPDPVPHEKGGGDTAAAAAAAAATTTTREGPYGAFERRTTHPVPPAHRQLTLGERLIPHITLESSVGQADKHVLRNVGKVEKFLVELIRKAVEDEVSDRSGASRAGQGSPTSYSSSIAPVIRELLQRRHSGP